MAVEPRPDPVAVEPRPEPVAVEPRPEPVAAEPRPELMAAEPRPEPMMAEPQPGSLVAEPRPDTVAGAGVEAVKPAGLEAAPEDGGDNLKRISGIGPKFEAMLHGLGVYRFGQIAGWGSAEIAWVEDNLEGFRGRIVREDWVGQAAVLAAGGDTDFSQRVDRGDVY
jgi:NADH-quinone oxidoreductase subunit E